MDDTKINDKKNKEDYIFLDKNNNSENDSYLNYLKNIQFGFYAFKLSGNLLSAIHSINYYIPISKIFNTLFIPVTNCKKKIREIKYNLNDNKITTNEIYYRYFSPLRKNKLKHEKQILNNINEENICNTWDIYEKEFNEKPKIGDVLEIHYSVPYDTKINSNKEYKSYIVTYTYPCNIIFPPYDLNLLKSYNLSKNYKNGILFANYDDNDITEKAIQLAGPMGNFYSDIPKRYGIQIPRQMLIDDDIKEKLIITDNNADEYEFESKSILHI